MKPQSDIIKDLMKLSRRWEFAVWILAAIATGLGITLAVVLIFTPEC